MPVWTWMSTLTRPASLSLPLSFCLSHIFSSLCVCVCAVELLFLLSIHIMVLRCFPLSSLLSRKTLSTNSAVCLSLSATTLLIKNGGSAAQTSEGLTMPVSVWTSTLKRTIHTAELLPFPKLRWKVLDEIQAGLYDGMTYEQIEEQFPEEFAARKRDKLRYRCLLPFLDGHRGERVKTHTHTHTHTHTQAEGEREGGEREKGWGASERERQWGERGREK